MLDKIRSGVVSVFSNKKFLAILLVAVLFIASAIYTYRNYVKPRMDAAYVPNKEFIQLSNSMATNDRILQKLDNEIKGAVKEIKEVKNMTELQNRKLYISE